MDETKESEYKRVAENLFIRQETGKYYLIVRINGVQIRKSLKTNIRAIANSKLEIELSKLGTYKSKTKKDTIPTFSAAYPLALQIARADQLRPRSVETLNSHLKLAAEDPMIGPLRVCDITSTVLLQYLRKRSVEASGHTANLDLQAFRRFFKMALEHSWCATNPAAEVPTFEHRAAKRHIPTAEEVNAVITFLRTHPHYIEDRNKAADFIEFLALSGVRLEGAQTVKWEDIHVDQGYFQVTEKGDKTRRINIFPQLKEFFNKHLKEFADKNIKPKGYVFGEVGYSPKKSLLTACRQVRVGGSKIKPFTFHGLRHYFATECLEAGISPSVIGGWLGHSDNGVLVMRLYADHIRARHFEQEANKVKINLGRVDVPANKHQYQNG